MYRSKGHKPSWQKNLSITGRFCHVDGLTDPTRCVVGSSIVIASFVIMKLIVRHADESQWARGLAESKQWEVFPHCLSGPGIEKEEIQTSLIMLSERRQT